MLGDEHRDTISARNNLAVMLGDQGRLEEAALILVEAVSLLQRILGENHPSTICAMNNSPCDRWPRLFFLRLDGDFRTQI
jgi:hypothetical protein